jgi:hypothetical protein
MKRLIALTALMASGLVAETVHLTPNGKTFHRTEQCAILKRSTTVLSAEKAVAEQHGLKPCRSCYAVRKANNRGWAK